MVAIGSHTLHKNLIRAPMAGVTDRPFRLLCGDMGVRIARRHVGWYLQARDPERRFRRRFNQLDDAAPQLHLLDNHFQTDQTEEVRVA